MRTDLVGCGAADVTVRLASALDLAGFHQVLAQHKDMLCDMEWPPLKESKILRILIAYHERFSPTLKVSPSSPVG